MCVMMGLPPTAAAAAIARPRSSSSRFVSTTCAAGKLRAEAWGESRCTTEDLFEVREGLRFDERGLRTLSSSRLIASQVPTSLDTELELIGDLVAASVSLCARRDCSLERILLCSSADPSK